MFRHISSRFSRYLTARKVAGQELDAMELLNVETHTAGEIDAMLASGAFQQSVHALAWLLSKQPSDKA